MASIDPRKSWVAELRYFGGLSIEKTAAVLGVFEITVKRECQKANAQLYRELSRE